MKRAVELGVGPEWYPVGREIADTWNGEDAPLIVAQYLDSTNNEAYGGAEGVICMRKYAVGFGTPLDSVQCTQYHTSSMRNEYLSNVYLEGCSNELKAVISTISIPYLTGIEEVTLPDLFAKMYIPAAC